MSNFRVVTYCTPYKDGLRLLVHVRRLNEQAKSLVTHGNGYGVISTVSSDGYPGGAGRLPTTIPRV
eukprot:1330758-Amorphochlora_amoeboformis.AAC.4